MLKLEHTHKPIVDLVLNKEFNPTVKNVDKLHDIILARIGTEKHTLKQLAEQYGISVERIRQLQVRGQRYLGRYATVIRLDDHAILYRVRYNDIEKLDNYILYSIDDKKLRETTELEVALDLFDHMLDWVK